MTPRAPNRDKLLSEFAHAFDSGAGDAFFRLWDVYVSSSSGAADSIDVKRLEFYLRVHFAVFPCRAELSTGSVASPSHRHDAEGSPDLNAKHLQVRAVAACG